MKKSIKYSLAVIIGMLSCSAFAQVNLSSSPNVTTQFDHPFLDASSYTDGNNNQNKGLYFPQTDLTAWTFITTPLDGITFPTAYDGMIVYNTGTGNTLADTSIAGQVVAVKPGFYYFYNPSSSGGTSITNGYWKALDSPVVEPWQIQGTTNKATANTDNIYQMGNVGIGLTTTTTNALHVKATSDPVRLEGLQTGVAGTDLQVVADATGVLKTVAASTNTAIVTKTANYTAVIADETILVDATAGTVTVTLPGTPVKGKRYNIKKKDTTGNTVTVNGNGHVIDDNASISGALPYQGWVLQYDGTSWYVVSRI